MLFQVVVSVFEEIKSKSYVKEANFMCGSEIRETV